LFFGFNEKMKNRTTSIACALHGTKNDRLLPYDSLLAVCVHAESCGRGAVREFDRRHRAVLIVALPIKVAVFADVSVFQYLFEDVAKRFVMFEGAFEWKARKVMDVHSLLHAGWHEVPCPI
jgi:hypothetical protein